MSVATRWRELKLKSAHATKSKRFLDVCFENHQTADTMMTLQDCWKAASVLTPARQKRFQEVLKTRLACVELVLDNVDDPHNRSAVFRTAEALGIYKVHVINQRAPRSSSRTVSMRSEQWMLLKGYTSVQSFLESQGSRWTSDSVWVAQAGEAARPLEEAFTVESSASSVSPICIIFGNEHEGVSAEWDLLKPQRFWIPMRGFTESLNISVAAAVTLHWITTLKRQQLKGSSDLMEHEQIELLRHWLAQSKATAAAASTVSLPFHPQASKSVPDLLESSAT